jgi:hypothetical protein
MISVLNCIKKIFFILLGNLSEREENNFKVNTNF